jgi:hypothetical protein
MNKTRFAKTKAVAAGLILSAAPGLTRAQSAPRSGADSDGALAFGSSAEKSSPMLTGYRRLEFGRIYRVLTPEQRQKSTRGSVLGERLTKRRGVGRPLQAKTRMLQLSKLLNSSYNPTISSTVSAVSPCQTVLFARGPMLSGKLCQTRTPVAGKCYCIPRPPRSGWPGIFASLTKCKEASSLLA